MNEEVEILKIGVILDYNYTKPILMYVSNGGNIYDYYISILDNIKSDYFLLKSDQSIIGKPKKWTSSLLGYREVDIVKGIQNDEAVVGKPYSLGPLDNEIWHTSEVKRIIDKCIIITKNEVYAIHNMSEIRDKKLKDLDI